MCGFAGELRRDGPPDRAALERMQADARPARAGRRRAVARRAASGSAHRRLAIIDLSARGAQPMVDEALGLAVAFNGCIYNYRELRAELERAGHAFASDARHRGAAQGLGRSGARACSTGSRACSRSRSSSATAAGSCSRATGSASSRCTCADVPTAALRFASTLPALLAGGGVDTSVDPVALHHYLSWHAVVPAPRTILRGVRKLAAGDACWSSSPTARRRERR